ncbi:unnamed protein product, partial [Pylaiella littoralis]
MRGMLPEKYFQVVVKKEHGELLDILGFSEEEAFEIFVQFISIDDDNSGEVSVDEFHAHLDSQATKFSERVFFILDQDLSGCLDLREFIIGVWNYCTYDTTLVSKLLFGIYDVDKRGRITMAELDSMLRMLYGTPDADPEVLKALAINGAEDEDALTFDEFVQAVKDNYEVAQPAFELQKAIRRKVLGVKYWEKMTRQRTKMYGSYDQGDVTSAEAVEAIVSTKQQERLRELERKRLEVAAQHDRELRQAAEEHRAIHDDNQLRKARRGCTRSTLYIKHKLNELRDARPPDEVEEENAWISFKEARAVINTDFTEGRVDELRAASREVVWDSYERAVASSKARAELKAARELELASDDDAKSKADAWILTKQGKLKYDFLCRQSYGNLLHKAYLESGSPMQAFAALHAPDESPVTLATRIAYDHPRPAMLKEAKASARASVLVAEAGARGTAWDRLWDVEAEDEYYLHAEEGGGAGGEVKRYPK